MEKVTIGILHMNAQHCDITIFSFFCAMVAAMTLRFLDPFGSGKLVLFQVTYDKVGAHLGS